MLLIVGSIEASNSFSSVMKYNGEKDCDSAEPQIPNKSDKDCKNEPSCFFSQSEAWLKD